MSSITFFIFFVFFLAFVLLAINLMFAPSNPYQEKESVFECGYHSFLGQNRTQFTISFFVFALLFLLFDLEILLVYPYVVSSYNNGIYGLVIMLIFFLVLTLGFAFELGKKALNIDTKQTSFSGNTLSFVKFTYNNIFLKIKKRDFSSKSAYYISPNILYIIKYCLDFIFFFYKKKVRHNFFRSSSIIVLSRNILSKCIVYLSYLTYKINLLEFSFLLYKYLAYIIISFTLFSLISISLDSFVFILLFKACLFISLIFVFIKISKYLRSEWNNLSIVSKSIIIVSLILILALDLYLLYSIVNDAYVYHKRSNIFDMLNDQAEGPGGDPSGQPGGPGGDPSPNYGPASLEAMRQDAERHRHQSAEQGSSRPGALNDHSNDYPERPNRDPYGSAGEDESPQYGYGNEWGPGAYPGGQPGGPGGYPAGLGGYPGGFGGYPGGQPSGPVGCSSENNGPAWLENGRVLMEYLKQNPLENKADPVKEAQRENRRATQKAYKAKKKEEEIDKNERGFRKEDQK